MCFSMLFLTIPSAPMTTGTVIVFNPHIFCNLNFQIFILGQFLLLLLLLLLLLSMHAKRKQDQNFALIVVLFLFKLMQSGKWQPIIIIRINSNPKLFSSLAYYIIVFIISVKSVINSMKG